MNKLRQKFRSCAEWFDIHQRKFLTGLVVIFVIGGTWAIWQTWENSQAVKRESKIRDAAIRKEVEDRTAANRTNSIQNCRIIGQPLLKVVVKIVNQQIKSSRNLPPGLLNDTDTLLRRIHNLNKRRRETIKPLVNAPPCAKRYPPLSEVIQKKEGQK